MLMLPQCDAVETELQKSFEIVLALLCLISRDL